MNIIQIFASSFWGGGEQYVYDLSNELLADGHSVTFFSQDSRVINERVAVWGKECIQLPFKGIADLKSAMRLSKYLSVNPVDVIHLHRFKDMFTVIFAKKISGSKAKIIITRHQVKRGKGSFIYRWAYKQVDKIIFVSRMAEQKFLEFVPGFPLSKSVVIHNSIPPLSESLKENECLRKEFVVAEDVPLIVYTGRVVPEKGIAQLIQALGVVREFAFFAVIIGTGKEEYINELLTLVAEKELSDRIVFAGFRSNVRTLICEADIGVLPSIVRESFGLTVAEFMQAGKSVITTNNGAQVEFVEHGETGLLVSPGDVPALADALSTLLSDKNLCARIGQRAREYFEEELSYDKFYHKILQTY